MEMTLVLSPDCTWNPGVTQQDGCTASYINTGKKTKTETRKLKKKQLFSLALLKHFFLVFQTFTSFNPDSIFSLVLCLH